MQPGPNPTPEAEGSADAGGSGSTYAGRPLQRGLLSRLSGSFGAAASAAAAAAGAATGQPGAQADRDLEQPLLPGSQAEEEQYVAHNMEHKRWPELRLSSISTRRLRCGAAVQADVLKGHRRCIAWRCIAASVCLASH